MKLSAVLVFLVLAANAETGTWNDVLALETGQKVRVVLTDMKSYKGRIEAVSGQSVSLLVRRSPMRFEREEVHRVTALGRSYQARKALIGAAIGGLCGVGIGAIADRGPHEIGEGDAGKRFFGLMGLGAGAGVGAALPAGKTVYRSTRAERSGSGFGAQMEGLPKAATPAPAPLPPRGKPEKEARSAVRGVS